jgi:hypothetical protein
VLARQREGHVLRAHHKKPLRHSHFLLYFHSDFCRAKSLKSNLGAFLGANRNSSDDAFLRSLGGKHNNLRAGNTAGSIDRGFLWPNERQAAEGTAYVENLNPDRRHAVEHLAAGGLVVPRVIAFPKDRQLAQAQSRAKFCWARTAAPDDQARRMDSAQDDELQCRRHDRGADLSWHEHVSVPVSRIREYAERGLDRRLHVRM